MNPAGSADRLYSRAAVVLSGDSAPAGVCRLLRAGPRIRSAPVSTASRVDATAEPGTTEAMAAGIVAAIVTTIIVVVVLAGFVWAAREDGRAQRRQDRLTGRRR